MRHVDARPAIARLFGSLAARRLGAGLCAISSIATITPAFAACDGDLDGDGAVNAADLGIMLGAWGGPGGAGSPDLDGDGIVGGADLATLLGAWGPCPASCGGFAPMAFAAQPVSLDPVGIPGAVVLDGFIDVTPFGAPSGSVTVSMPSGVIATIAMAPGMTTITTPGAVLDIVPFAGPGVVLVDGLVTPTTSVLSTFQADLASGAPLSAWSATSQATMAMVAISVTDEWGCNVQTARTHPVDGLGEQGFWCKTAAYAGAAAVIVLAGTGCSALTAGCATATTVTIGGMALPCVWVVNLCAGGVFIGSAAVYEGILAFWGDEQD